MTNNHNTPTILAASARSPPAQSHYDEALRVAELQATSWMNSSPTSTASPNTTSPACLASVDLRDLPVSGMSHWNGAVGDRVP